MDLDDAVSDDEVLAAANGANGDMADAPLTTGEASLSDLRVPLASSGNVFLLVTLQLEPTCSIHRFDMI